MLMLAVKIMMMMMVVVVVSQFSSICALLD